MFRALGGVAGEGAPAGAAGVIMSNKRSVNVRRVYEVPGAGPGYRVLVDRLWPRGLKRDALRCDEWAKDVAPSPELRRWYGHDPAKFEEFSARYRQELTVPPASEAIAGFVMRYRGGALTLLTATKDVEHSAAVVLAGVVEERAASRA